MTLDTTSRKNFEKGLAVLVERFGKHYDEYKRPTYSETDVRAEFIDRFFEALGWDVYHKLGGSPSTREVYREAGETHGRVDYVFRVDGRDVFYVEAKAPHVPIDRVDVVMQAKSYAWHSPDVYVAAVTDFEEFRLYDATAKPDRKHPGAGLIFSYNYTSYLDPKALDELWLLSKESVAAGSIDQLLKKSSVQARQRIPVDKAFLEDLSKWREELAKAVFKATTELSPSDLNSVVQVFLDRLIFIRICEDRRIMAQNQLKEVADNWEYSGKRVSITNDLNALFHEVNERLNGEIFKPHQSEKIDWDINAELVANIIKNLYFPVSPYFFDKIPVELLGSIYERYLGKTIRVTATRAVVEDKPEVRKAGGVYYTPKYIVDYIVAQTVGKLIEEKTPKQIEKLRLLDPACGSGSFLIGAYQKLLDYHKQYYSEHARAREANAQPRLIESEEGGELKLSLEEKATILRNNIFGVDIDPQAVEITMMSLYIKMLEDEHGILSGRALLPRLRDNIKCGNSLIGYDIGALSDEDKARINPFDWSSKGEGFGEIMAAGGFDAVIGNPPYVLGRETFDEKVKKYLATNYKVFKGKYDLYIYFSERAVSLLKNSGRFSFILPNTVLANENASKLRQMLLNNTSIKTIKVFTDRVFSKAQVESVILVISKERDKENIVTVETEAVENVPQTIFSQNLDYRLNVRVNVSSQTLIAHIESKSVSLGNLADICIGIQLGGSSGSNRKASFLSNTQKDTSYQKVLDGKNINRYQMNWDGRFVRYGDWLHRKRDEKYFLNPKIVIRQIGQVPIATYDDSKFYTLNTIYNLINTSDYALEYFLGIINSHLGKWFWMQKNSDFKMIFPKIKKAQIEAIPVWSINFSDPADKSRHDKMVALVDKMLDLHKQKQAFKSESARERIEREIAVTDEQIDALVYELYGLTKEEIKVVEGG